jgi:hypothetical protein
VLIEVQGVLAQDKQSSSFLPTRSAAIRYLLESLLGLIRAANANESIEDDKSSNGAQPTRKCRSSIERPPDERPSRRTRVHPDIWQDTLSLLCDEDILIRRECVAALIYYITQEMPKHGEINDGEGSKHLRRVAETSFRHVQSSFPHAGDAGSKFLHAVHAYIYILATSPTLSRPSVKSSLPEPGPSVSTTVVSPPDCEEHYNLADSSENLAPHQGNNRRSFASQHGPRARKESLVLRLLEKTSTQYTISAKASEEDYVNILKILSTVHTHLPLHGLLTGIPMLLALNNVSDISQVDSHLLQRVVTIKTVIAHVWLAIGQVWKISELALLAEQVCPLGFGEESITLLNFFFHPRQLACCLPCQVKTSPRVLESLE